MPTSRSTGPYVWVYLPGELEPVVAGVLQESTVTQGLAFAYGRSYLSRDNAISLGPDLPLTDDTFSPISQHRMPSSIRDAMPDSWGRQVINRDLGVDLEDVLPDVRYMLLSGSDRAGALDFQAAPDVYVPRAGGGKLTRIAETALAVDDDEPVGAELLTAVRNTLTAAGGSQPKAFVVIEGRRWLAKFQTFYDRQSPLIKAERAALFIANKAGLEVPEARLVKVDGRGIALLTERFDRVGATRRQVISGFTVADDHRPSGVPYPKLVENLRALSEQPSTVGRELFRRLAFRIAMRVDDDHLRNVAFFWDGAHATFTPAYDLSPDLVSTPTALGDFGDGVRTFNLSALVGQHRYYHLSFKEAQLIADEMVDAVVTHRADAAEVAQMAPHEKELLLTATATRDIVGPRLVSAPQWREQ